MGKSQTKKYLTKNIERSNEVRGKVFANIEIVGVISLDGYLYLLVFVGDYSRFVIAFPLRTRTYEEILARFEDFRKIVLTQIKKEIECVEYLNTNQICETDPKILQMDHAKEFEKPSKLVQSQFDTHYQFRVDYEPAQNGLVERKMRSIMGRTRAIYMKLNY